MTTTNPLHGTPEQRAQIEAINPMVYPAGSKDDLLYRLSIVEAAEFYNQERKQESLDEALRRLGVYIKTLALRPASNDVLEAEALKHAAYLRAQKQTTDALNSMIMGASK